jgi:hypothetical protein
MTRVELAEATAPLADYARKAKRGPVVFTRKGRPVAMLRLLTDEEREDYLVSNHPGFVELIRRSRETYPPGTGIAIQEIERDLAANTSRRAPVRKRSSRRKG